MDHLYIQCPIGILHVTVINEVIVKIDLENEIKESTKFELKDMIIQSFEAYFNGTLLDFDLPYYIEGSTFRKEVLEETKRIPFGETRSYLDLSMKCFNMNKSRAVGQALNKNPLMILIPCHRVIGKNQSLVGYNGGLELKQFLLNHEKNMVKKG